MFGFLYAGDAVWRMGGSPQMERFRTIFEPHEKFVSSSGAVMKELFHLGMFAP
jgi:hypothetical protein